ncbi:hypothetical protein [Niveibacterium sp. SC-1]|uniref:hypothetical protein n=1 Tax=Niveibacterium sp. SC-1 TaxID=3135646 RepID=UPI00311F7313
MANIIAARFETYRDAERTIDMLVDRGLAREDTSVFYLNAAGQHARFPMGGDEYADPASRGAGSGTALGILVGAAVGGAFGLIGISALEIVRPIMAAVAVGGGAYVGTLIGTLVATRRAPRFPMARAEQPRKAGVMLAVRLAEERLAATVIEIIGRAGGRDPERAQGVWRAGDWVDFNPLSKPVPVRSAPGFPGPGIKHGMPTRHAN